VLVYIPSLKKSHHLDYIDMSIGIVGSRKLAHPESLEDKWNIFAPNLNIYGFEADKVACEKLNRENLESGIDWNEKHFPIALWNSCGRQNLYLTNFEACSSLYPPNLTLMERFKDYALLTEVKSILEVETSTLDIVAEAENFEEIDFLEIDVQGGELHVLEGALQTINRSVLGIMVEVEFSPLYKDQPLFSDVDLFLKKQGFDLFGLAPQYVQRAVSPIHSNARPGQLLWANAFYFRDPISQDPTSEWNSPEKILKLACIADTMLFPDYALELLAYLTTNYGYDSQYNFAINIIESLSQFPQLVEQGLDTLPIVQQMRDYID
jgi:FkbM family methyltransferase